MNEPTKMKDLSVFKSRTTYSKHNRNPLPSMEERLLNLQKENNNGVALSKSQEEEVELKLSMAIKFTNNFEMKIKREHDGHDYGVIGAWFSIYNNEQNGWSCPLMCREIWEPLDPTHKFRKLGKEWNDFKSAQQALQNKYPYIDAKMSGYFDMMRASDKKIREEKALKRKAKREAIRS